MVKDLSFLNIKDDDSSEMKAMKAHWQMVMDMPKPERQYFLQEERVREEENYLKWMIQCNREDDANIEFFTDRARNAVSDYELYHDEALLDKAEAYTELAHSTKGNRFTIKDIRKQRERIQWEKKKLSQMVPKNSVTKPSTEPSQS